MPEKCQYLRTKMDYVAHAYSGAADVGNGAGGSQKHFWCLRTMKPIGPDGAPADESLCVKGRDCFLAEGEE